MVKAYLTLLALLLSFKQKSPCSESSILFNKEHKIQILNISPTKWGILDIWLNLSVDSFPYLESNNSSIPMEKNYMRTKQNNERKAPHI